MFVNVSDLIHFVVFNFFLKILDFDTFIWKLTVRKMAIVLLCVSHSQFGSIFHFFKSSSVNLMKKMERWMFILWVLARIFLKYHLSTKIQQLFSKSIGEIFSPCSTLNQDIIFIGAFSLTNSVSPKSRIISKHFDI